MDDDRFGLIIDVMNILLKYKSDPKIEDCCIDMIKAWSSEFTNEQKARLLKIVVQFDRMSDEKKKVIDKEIHRQQMQSFLGAHYQGDDAS